MDPDKPCERPKLATIPRLSRDYGVGERLINAGIDAGELRVFRLGRWPRLDRMEFALWLASKIDEGRAATNRKHEGSS